MLILLDMTNLKMVAASAKLARLMLIAKHCFPEVETHIVDSQDGKTWTKLTGGEMSILFTNMSGMQEAPDFPMAIEQLRNYSNSWPEYDLVTDEELEAMEGTQAIPGPLEPEEEPYVAPIEEPEPDEPVSRATHQAIISGVEAANAKAKAEGRAPEAATKAQPEKKEPSAPRKQGATKRVWDIADGLKGDTVIANIKIFRTHVIAACEAEGINPGTAATQFGKWKADKGL